MRGILVAVSVLVLSASFVVGGGMVYSADSSAGTPTEPVPTPQHPTTPSSSEYDVNVERIEDLIHQKMNEHRRKNGVEPLSRNETLDAIARYKSWDMAQRDYFGHTGPNGTPHMAVRDRFGARCNQTGQNIYKKNYLTNDDRTALKLSDEHVLASDAVNALLNSPGHRQNALAPYYDSQGIGVFVDENGTVFVTQELCG